MHCGKEDTEWGEIILFGKCELCVGKENGVGERYLEEDVDLHPPNWGCRQLPWETE